MSYSQEIRFFLIELVISRVIWQPLNGFFVFWFFFFLIFKIGAEGMAQQLKAFAALAQDLSSVPSTQVRQLTAACASQHSLLDWPPWASTDI